MGCRRRSTAARPSPRRGGRAGRAARVGRRQRLGRPLHRELRRLGSAVHRRTRRPASGCGPARGRVRRRPAPAQGNAGRARGLRRDPHRTDRPGRGGMAVDAMGAAPRPSAATAHRIDVAGRRLALSHRDAVRPRPAQRDSLGTVQPAGGDRRRLAVAGRDVRCRRGRADSRAAAVLHSPARRRGAAVRRSADRQERRRPSVRRAARAHPRRARRTRPRDLPRVRGACRAGADHLRHELDDRSGTPAGTDPGSAAARPPRAHARRSGRSRGRACASAAFRRARRHPPRRRRHRQLSTSHAAGSSSGAASPARFAQPGTAR